MKPLHRGIALGVLQCLLVLSVAGKYAWDRERLPRAWARTGPIDPYLPVRGRYVSLQLEVVLTPAVDPAFEYRGFELFAENGLLKVRPASGDGGAIVNRGAHAMLAEPVAYFIPEHAADPASLRPGEELWAEVSVPKSGPPRPIRLGIRRNGVLTPFVVR